MVAASITTLASLYMIFAEAKEPGLPPLRVLRESGGGVLNVAHMALGDPHMMALMGSLDHMPGLTSIDVSDNRSEFVTLERMSPFPRGLAPGSSFDAFVMSGIPSKDWRRKRCHITAYSLHVCKTSITSGRARKRLSIAIQRNALFATASSSFSSISCLSHKVLWSHCPSPAREHAEHR